MQKRRKTTAVRKPAKPVMTIKPREAQIASTSSAISQGRSAPDFSLKTTPDQVVTLKEFRGRPVVLAFYPADFSPVCGDEMTLFNELLPEFDRFNAQVLGISVDNVYGAILRFLKIEGSDSRCCRIFIPRETSLLCIEFTEMKMA